MAQDPSSPPAQGTEAIDPVISEPPVEVSLTPVVRPAAETEKDSGGFVRSLTESLASSWHASTEADAVLEWEEYDAEAAERAQREAQDTENVRHEFTPGSVTGNIYSPHTASQAAVTGSSGSGQSRVSLSGHTSSVDQVSPGQPITGGMSTGGVQVAGAASAPQTDGALAAEPIRRRSVLRPSWLKGRAHGSAKKQEAFDRTVFDQKVKPQQVFRRIFHPERAVTGAIPLVEYLAGTPYANPYQAENPAGTDELEIIGFVLDLGEALFRYGAGALEVETSIIAVTTAFGMKNTDVDITNQSISLNWAPEGQIPYSRVRVVRSWSRTFKGLASVHQLVTDIIAGRITRREAVERLEAITHEPKPYPRWLVTIAGATFASLFAAFLGAPIWDALLGFGSTILVLLTMRQLAVWRVPEYFGLAAGGFVATFIAMAAFALEMPIAPSIVVAGGLMIILPSARIVSAIQDAINGFPITSAGRLVSAMIAFAGMTSGIMAAVVTADMLGAPPIEVAQGMTRIYHPTVLIALVFLAAMAAAIVEQTSVRMLLPTGAISALGFSVYYAGELLGLGERIIPILGATVVGALGRVVALRMGAPQLVVAVPAMMFMLPGLMIFRGMYQIAMGSSTDFMMGGLTQLFNALIIILAIAAGIVLGDVCMRPLTSSLQSNERARPRSR